VTLKKGKGGDPGKSEGGKYINEKWGEGILKNSGGSEETSSRRRGNDSLRMGGCDTLRKKGGNLFKT